MDVEKGIDLFALLLRRFHSQPERQLRRCVRPQVGTCSRKTLEHNDDSVLYLKDTGGWNVIRIELSTAKSIRGYPSEK